MPCSSALKASTLGGSQSGRASASASICWALFQSPAGKRAAYVHARGRWGAWVGAWISEGKAYATQGIPLLSHRRTRQNSR